MCKYSEELVDGSPRMRMNAAVAESLRSCVFARSVTDKNLEFISNSISDDFDAGVTPNFIHNIGLKTLRLKAAFNNTARCDEEDNRLPSFFYEKSLPPTDKIVRLRDSEMNAAMQNLLDVHSG